MLQTSHRLHELDRAPNERIWAKDINSKGAKKFIKGDITNLWNMYKNAKHKNYYECISTNMWCYLHFDVEFKYALNPDKKKQYFKIMNDFAACLKSTFNEISEKHTIILDASNKTKFSQHWIIKNIVFQSNTHIKCCLDILITKIQKHYASLIIVDGKGYATIIDESIYTKNRMMRIIGSYKWGDYRPLKYYVKTHKTITINQMNKEQFIETLIGITDPSTLVTPKNTTQILIYINDAFTILQKHHVSTIAHTQQTHMSPKQSSYYISNVSASASKTQTIMTTHKTKTNVPSKTLSSAQHFISKNEQHNIIKNNPAQHKKTLPNPIQQFVMLYMMRI